MRFLNLLDLAFLALKKIVLPPQDIPGDDFEVYSDGAPLNGLDVGWCGDVGFNICWSTPYADRRQRIGVQAYDTFETYADGASVAGLNGGEGFSGAFVVH